MSANELIQLLSFAQSRLETVIESGRIAETERSEIEQAQKLIGLASAIASGLATDAE